MAEGLQKSSEKILREGSKSLVCRSNCWNANVFDCVSPVVLKMQGAWGAKDIMNGHFKYVDRVNKMAEGDFELII